MATKTLIGVWIGGILGIIIMFRVHYKTFPDKYGDEDEFPMLFLMSVFGVLWPAMIILIPLIILFEKLTDIFAEHWKKRIEKNPTD